MSVDRQQLAARGPRGGHEESLVGHVRVPTLHDPNPARERLALRTVDGDGVRESQEPARLLLRQLHVSHQSDEWARRAP